MSESRHYRFHYADSTGRECRIIEASIVRAITDTGHEYEAVRTLSEKHRVVPVGPYEFESPRPRTVTLRIARVERLGDDGAWHTRRWPVPMPLRFEADPSNSSPPPTWPT